ncbi:MULTISPECIES: HD domain-containing protein [unclassified Variovorax]|uniref:HD domain-containing protein n=1 Tax=unclassified Variovorax TaxID=663243 RepID=UPI001318EE3D|nr:MULTISPECIES: HD domain-containing protein [unclassified Variovorax]VTU42876.1 Bifunctional (p)ppGpp synthase/hydrolase relA [Variovorax sp. PBL-H6]VTU43614.1 Bifunctional (p)ppGpp synthase/hydrolase relA [Variovorax sp. SRS16]VTU43676.1 Bifunctional (p)ppGpp synthase/hydrolase relA [Variovorax sp. PBL-E5]
MTTSAFNHLRFDAPVPEEAVVAARAFAIKAHGDQVYGDKSYVEGHLDRVEALVRFYKLPNFFRVGAYLHDTLEDTAVTQEELAQSFGVDIGDMVDCVSGFGETRRERNEDIVGKLQHNPQYVPLKLLDRLANVEACVEEGKLEFLPMYRKEMPMYYGLFSAAYPEAYARLCRALNW